MALPPRRERRAGVPAEGRPRLRRQARWCSRRASSPISRWSGRPSPTGTATCGSTPPPGTSTRPPRCRAGSPSSRPRRSSRSGELAADDIHLPGVFVKRVVALTPEQATRKMIEKRTTTPRPRTSVTRPMMPWTREQMAARAASGAAGRPVRQPGHRPADPHPEPPARGRPRRPAFGERDPGVGPLPVRRRGRPRSDQRRQGDGDGRAGGVLLRLGDQFRDDPRRAHRRGRAGRHAGRRATATSRTGWCPARWSRAWAVRWTWSTGPIGSSS